MSIPDLRGHQDLRDVVLKTRTQLFSERGRLRDLGEETESRWGDLGRVGWCPDPGTGSPLRLGPRGGARAATDPRDISAKSDKGAPSSG